jgi:glucose/arabinose dehydrogenase
MVIPFLLAVLQADEADVYPITTIVTPEHVVLEVGGFAILPDDQLLICTRRGQIWRVENAYRDGTDAKFHLWFDGLQEPLGLLEHDGWIYTAQRAELSRLRDSDGDGRADELETIADPWEISGNYHEYAFGPTLGGDGRLWVTLNRPFGEEPFGSAKWRGFAVAIDPATGAATFECAGLRSPAGVATAPWGDVFYTDNQGEWCGASKLSRLVPGSFHGHPWGIESTKLPEWKHGPVPMPPDKTLMPLVKATVPTFELPAVWFPYDEMGRSPAGFVWDTEGRFGSHFRGHIFVGDQYDASLIRVTLEEVNGVYQGACYPFLMGLASGVTRVHWGADGSLLVGMTNRGWGSRGQGTFGLQRVTWSGATPFELREMRALADGFELDFTAPIDAAPAAQSSTWSLTSYTYELHEEYGSPKMDEQALAPLPTVLDDHRVKLTVPGLRAGYVHELRYPALRSAAGAAPLHDRAYYTLVELPTAAPKTSSAPGSDDPLR